MIRISTFLAIGALANSIAVAQDDAGEAEIEPRRYTVEIIIFEYAENVAVGTEVFPPDAPPVSDEQAFAGALNAAGVAIDADGEPVPVYTDAASGDDGLDAAQAAGDATVAAGYAFDPVLLLADEFSLEQVLDKLERLDAYRPILHTGWTQATVPLEESTALELDYFGKTPAGLDGSFMLYLNRYLHLVVDLTLDGGYGEYQGPAAYGEPVVSFGDERLGHDADPRTNRGAIKYRIQEDRIVKNGDVRYFDHPKFGVIAKVSRVEEPEENAANGTGPESVSLLIRALE